MLLLKAYCLLKLAALGPSLSRQLRRVRAQLPLLRRSGRQKSPLRLAQRLEVPT